MTCPRETRDPPGAVLSRTSDSIGHQGGKHCHNWGSVMLAPTPTPGHHTGICPVNIATVATVMAGHCRRSMDFKSSSNPETGAVIPVIPPPTRVDGA